MDAFVGIDPGTIGPGFAIYGSDDRVIETDTPALRGANWRVRLPRLRDALEDFLRSADRHHDIVAIGIERPNTSSSNLAVVSAWAVCIEVTNRLMGCPIFDEIGSMQWKKEIVGHGHASDAAVQHFALTAGWTGGPHDGAVATCLAACAKSRYDASIEFANRRPDA